MLDDPNICTSTLDDGSTYTFHLDVCNKIADEVIDELLEKQDVVENFDFGAAMFAMFISSIHVLLDYGWSEADLMKEIRNHAAEETGHSVQ